MSQEEARAGLFEGTSPRKPKDKLDASLFRYVGTAGAVPVDARRKRFAEKFKKDWTGE